MFSKRCLFTVLAVAFVTVSASCAPAARAKKVRFPPGELDRIKQIFAYIDERNATEKRSEAWLREAYTAIGIKNVHAIAPQDHASYGRFATNGEVYLIVHPGYFPFFDKWRLPSPPPAAGSGYPEQNLADRLTADLPDDEFAYRVAREQSRVLRDFLEFMSVEDRLVVLILPRDYRNHLTYGYRAGHDEYARFINDLTNGAENIVYMESDTASSGYMLDAELAVLASFLRAADVRTVMLGGGFLAKCLDNFYGSLRNAFPFEAIAYVPELTAISPADDMVTGEVDLLTRDGRLNMKSIRKYISTVAYNRANGEPIRTQNFGLYPIYHNRSAAALP